jgi:hypothetical protein
VLLPQKHSCLSGSQALPSSQAIGQTIFSASDLDARNGAAHAEPVWRGALC